MMTMWNMDEKLVDIGGEEGKDTTKEEEERNREKRNKPKKRS